MIIITFMAIMIIIEVTIMIIKMMVGSFTECKT